MKREEDHDNICGICAEPLLAGQPALFDITLGEVHAACCGPERESYVNLETGDPLRPDEPLPTPHPFEPQP